jgi:myo-inositol 2-dehydrogenase/D-chiro-inositol 1-dehydrogenase
MDEHMAMTSTEPGTRFPAGPPHMTFAERFHTAYRAEMAAFVDVVLGRRENPCTPEDAVAASMVADAAQASLQSGEPVRVALQAAG